MDETLRYMNDSFCTIDRFLRIVGFHYFSNNNWDSKLKLIHQIFNAFIACCIFLCSSGFCIYCTEDLFLWIEAIGIWITGIMMYISVGISLVFRRKFRLFLEEMAFKDIILDMPFIDQIMKTTHEEGKIKELKDLAISTQHKLFKYTLIFLKYFSAGTTATAFAYLPDAIVKMIIREDASMRILAYPMLFPWKLDNWIVYGATFVFHAYMGIFTALVYSCFQTTIVLLVGQIIRQLNILTFIILHLDELVMELKGAGNDRWQACCSSVLAQCVDHYIKVKNFSNRLNVIYQPFYLFLVLDATLCVCLCTVQISISESLVHLFKYCVQETFFTLMVFFFCMLGQQILNKCEELENAVTEKWYLYDKGHKKSVLIFHMALRQGMPIYIFGSVVLSLPTFSWFIRTGMSFFTLIMSVLED